MDRGKKWENEWRGRDKKEKMLRYLRTFEGIVEFVFPFGKLPPYRRKKKLNFKNSAKIYK
jgi:hypothetical protein